MMSDTTFVDEIQDMIWAFGDIGKGLLATAQLMEKIVHHQLLWLWSAVVNTADMHDSPVPTIEHFIFLLRKNKSRWDRLLRYLQRKNYINHTRNQYSTDPLKVPTPSIYLRCVIYMKELDPLWKHEDDNFSDRDYRRLMRCDEASRYQDPAKYEDFAAARRVSFGHGGSCEKFSSFLNRIDVDHLRNVETTDLMAFFAYEMIGEIVDLVLITRNPAEYRQISPADVREVMRRLMSMQILPGALFLRLPGDGRNNPILCF